MGEQPSRFLDPEMIWLTGAITLNLLFPSRPTIRCSKTLVKSQARWRHRAEDSVRLVKFTTSGSVVHEVRSFIRSRSSGARVELHYTSEE